MLLLLFLFYNYCLLFSWSIYDTETSVTVSVGCSECNSNMAQKCKYATSKFGPPMPKTRLGHLKTYHNIADNLPNCFYYVVTTFFRYYLSIGKKKLFHCTLPHQYDLFILKPYSGKRCATECSHKQSPLIMCEFISIT